MSGLEMSQSALAILLIVSLFAGVGAGAVYDLCSPLCAMMGRVYSESVRKSLDNRIMPQRIRGVFRESKTGTKERVLQRIVTVVHDICFMAFSGACVALILYLFNDGVFRLGVLAVFLCGVLIYRSVFRRITLKLTEALYFLPRCVYGFTVYFARRIIKKGRKIKGGAASDGRNEEKKSSDNSDRRDTRRDIDHCSCQSDGI